MKEINKIPLLNKDEEAKIAKLAAEGDREARECLVNSNLRFVVLIAKKYQGKGLALEDLISEGNVGILNAIKYFDAEKNCRFITYAVWWVRQSIMKALHDKGRMIRLPSNKSKALIKIEKTRDILQNEAGNNNDPEIMEIAKYLKMSPEKVNDLVQIGQSPVSLDDSASINNDTSTIIDYIEDNNNTAPDENAINSVLKDDLDKALESLEERDADIIRCRYGLGESKTMTLKEIGARFNLTRERVRQIESRALRQLKSAANGNLKSYTA